MFTNCDIRGVPRGQCSVNNCECDSFARPACLDVGGTSNASLQCGWCCYCGHPPTSHSRIGLQVAVQEQPTVGLQVAVQEQSAAGLQLAVQEQPLMEQSAGFVVDKDVKCEPHFLHEYGNEETASSPPAQKRSHLELCAQQLEKKKVNFTERERAILIGLVDKHKAIIENKKSDAVSSSRKRAVWLRIEEEFNSRHGVSKRSEKQLKKCWDNLKERSKREKGTDSRGALATVCGSPYHNQMTDELQRVAAVAGQLSARTENSCDSDRGRRSTDPCSSGSNTPAAMIQAAQDPEDVDWQEGSPDDDIDMAQSQPSPQPAASDETLGGSAAAILRLPVSSAAAEPPAVVAPQEHKHSSSSADELPADERRKQKEHMLRVKMLRAQLHQQKQLFELTMQIKKSKLQLLRTKTALLKGKQ